MSAHSENESEDLGSEIWDEIRSSESDVDFKEVNSFEDFKILVNGLVINSELSKRLQIKYYELLLQSKTLSPRPSCWVSNCELVAGMIAETFNIADAIKASTVTTFQDSFKKRKKTLKAFQGLGLNVGFAC